MDLLARYRLSPQKFPLGICNFRSRALAAALLGILVLEPPSARALAAAQIHVNPAKTVADISPLLWGTNSLCWIDNNSALQGDDLVCALKGLSIGLLRFPGGTAAQNYSWRTNAFINKAVFPFEQKDILNTDGFIALCRKIGAAPDIVVNIGTWALKGDLAAGAREAADWVRYCNKEKGYAVKYWELGNEDYFMPSQTAKEYAEAVKLYAEAMKQVDPTIQVALNGPWSTAIYGEGDMAPSPMRKIMADYEEHIDSVQKSAILKQARQDLKKQGPPAQDTPTPFKEILDDYRKRAKSPEQISLLRQAEDSLKTYPFPYETWAQPWWKTIIPICGGSVDMVVLHVYYPAQRIPDIITEFSKVRALFTSFYPDKSYRWFYSEFNNKDSEPENLRALNNMELWLRLTEAGMDMACVWPFRWDSDEFEPLLDQSTNRLRPHGEVLATITKAMQGQLVAASSSMPALPVFAAVSGKRLVVALFGTRLQSSQSIVLSSSQILGNNISGTAWTANSKGDGYETQPVLVKQGSDGLRLDIPPQSLVIVTITSE